MVGRDRTDDCGLLAERVRLHGGKNRIRLFRGDDGQKFPFIGDVERVEPKDFACALNLFTDGNPCFYQRNADPAL